MFYKVLDTTKKMMYTQRVLIEKANEDAIRYSAKHPQSLVVVKFDKEILGRYKNGTLLD